MFLKPFRIKSNTLCEGSNKVKLKQEIVSTYSILSPEQVDDLIPDEVPLFIIRLVTYGGVVVTTYHVNLEPMFFEHGNELVPSVYALWKHPTMLRRIVMNLPAMSRLRNGADLVLHGLNTDERDGGLSVEGVVADEYCSAQAKGQEHTSGVVVSMMSYTDMCEAGVAGKGFKVLQIQGDLLWEMGSMITPINSGIRSLSPSQLSRNVDEVIHIASPVPPNPNDAPAATTTGIVATTTGIVATTIPSSDGKKISGNDAYFEDFKAAALTAMRHRQAPEAERKAAIIKALEERSKYLGSVHTKVELQEMTSNSDIHLRHAHGAIGSLSKCPEVNLYQEAQSLLDNGDDDVDEIDVSVPDDYNGSTDDNDMPPETGEFLQLKEKEEMIEESENETVNFDVNPEFMNQHEDQVRRIEARLRAAGLNLGSGLGALLSGIQSGLIPGHKIPKKEFDNVVEVEDDIGISVPEQYKSGDTSSSDNESNDSGHEAAGKEQEEEDGLEGGVVSSWYSISEGPGRGASSGGGTTDIQEMDDLLKECFFEGIKLVKKSGTALPLLTSSLYRTYMVETCPSDMRLDVKKSSYKKLSRFLLTMQSQGVIALKENEKGSEVIVEIDYKHPLVKHFVPSIIPASSESAPMPEHQIKSIKISSLHMPSHRQVPMYRLLGFNKTSLLEYQQVRESVMKYVKDNELADKDNPMLVIPDPVLTDAMGPNGASCVRGVLRPDLIKMVVEEMKPAYSITYGKGSPIIRRGKLEPVRLTLAQRMGNKKVTLVDNLEVYGIPASDVAHSLQRIAAASATVTDVTGHSSARQVLVQGNAIKTVAKLLEESYGLPIKHVEAINKIKPPKATKKKKKRK